MLDGDRSSDFALVGLEGKFLNINKIIGENA